MEALPRVGGKSVILTVVDRFNKYCHFIPLAHLYSAESMAQAFFTDIVQLHGVPQSMVSDHDPVFTSKFWRELMRLMGAKLAPCDQLAPMGGVCSVTHRPMAACVFSYAVRDWVWLPLRHRVHASGYIMSSTLVSSRSSRAPRPTLHRPSRSSTTAPPFWCAVRTRDVMWGRSPN